MHELWVVDSDGENERKLLDFGPIYGTDIQYDVAADDQIVGAQYRRHRTELWMATLHE